jgi:2-hydroxy-6-oxonona-2,4-dienedioate hydrolase
MAVWRNEAARLRLEAWFEHFRARIGSPVESLTVATSHGPSHVLVGGPGGGPPLVCLHAMRTGSAHLLSEFHPLLDRFRVIAPDLPGQSVRGPQVRLSLSDRSHADWLIEVLDQLGVTQAGLIGISWGGFVARLAASAHPDRFSRLALVVPAGIVNGSHWRGLTRMAIPMLRYRLQPSPHTLRQLLDPIITTWDDDWGAYMGDSISDMRPDFRIPPLAKDGELRALRLPTLVLGAEHDISFPGKAMLQRIQALVPHADTELLRGSRHCPPTTPEFREWLGQRLGTFAA